MGPLAGFPGEASIRRVGSSRPGRAGGDGLDMAPARGSSGSTIWWGRLPVPPRGGAAPLPGSPAHCALCSRWPSGVSQGDVRHSEFCGRQAWTKPGDLQRRCLWASCACLGRQHTAPGGAVSRVAGEGPWATPAARGEGGMAARPHSHTALGVSRAQTGPPPAPPPYGGGGGCQGLVGSPLRLGQVNRE